LAPVSFSEGVTMGSNETGELGARRYERYLKSNSRVLEWRKVTSIEEQFKGYDYVVRFQDLGLKKVELKTEEFNLRGTMTIEDYSHKKIGRLGWGHTFEADILVFNFLDESVLYHYTGDGIRHWMRHAPKAGVRYRLQQKHEQTNDTYNYHPNIFDMVAYTNGWWEFL
jgi:hypothetical protein